MDKVGRSMGLPFPAGREVDELAQKYDALIHTNIPKFPLVLPADSLDFSFSGIKSAAIREIELRKIHNKNEYSIHTDESESLPPDKGGKGGCMDIDNEPRELAYIPYRHDLSQKAQENRSNPTPFEYDMYYKILKV